MATSAHLRAGNQPPPLAGYDLFSENRPLVEALRREGAADAEERCAAFGRLCGGDPLELGRLANEHPPVLRTHDRFGERIDEVEFHPAWHELLGLGVEHGLHSLPWRAPGDWPRRGLSPAGQPSGEGVAGVSHLRGRTPEGPTQGAHVARATLFMTLAYAEAGVGCPLSMTFAAVPALRSAAPDLAAEWEPRLTSTTYDPGPRPPAGKTGALCGMAMTERQGGSDVRANETRAEPSNGAHRLTGHKWFCSAPMSDAFLVLAQAQEGLTCFLLPRVLEDGTRNGLRVERLKDKLGNRSNASAEIRLEEAFAYRVGDEGRGVTTIIEMVVHTRLDCVLGSTALMRRAVAEATHHAAHRSAFGRLLAEQPLMQNVLADLCLDSEAATATALRLARAFDEGDHAFRRLATAVAKYWVCKATPPLVAEALECLGGNGYVEESGLPRLFRESPLNSIWEGSGNVNCLDVLRALEREPESLEAFRAELALARGDNPHLDTALAGLDQELSGTEDAERVARRLVERMALCLQGSLLVRHAPAEVADAFCAARLGDEGGRAYGTLPRGVDAAAIVERHRPGVG
jgi:putative acyl-CoA dehydrogenase